MVSIRRDHQRCPTHGYSDIQDSHRFLVFGHWGQSTQLRVFFLCGRALCGSFGGAVPGSCLRCGRLCATACGGYTTREARMHTPCTPHAYPMHAPRRPALSPWLTRHDDHARVRRCSHWGAAGHILACAYRITRMIDNHVSKGIPGNMTEMLRAACPEPLGREPLGGERRSRRAQHDISCDSAVRSVILSVSEESPRHTSRFHRQHEAQ